MSIRLFLSPLIFILISFLLIALVPNKKIKIVATSLVFNDSKYEFQDELITIYPNETAVLIIDPWDIVEEPRGEIIDGYKNKVANNIGLVLSPALKKFREINLKILVASYVSFDLVDERILNNENINLAFINEGYGIQKQVDLFNAYLKKNNINTIIYAGYSADGCLLSRPIGALRMLDEVDRVIVLKDSIVAKEYDYTIDKELMKEISINMIEKHANGYSTYSKEFF